MNHKLESRLPRKISTTSDMQMIPLLMTERKEEPKSLLMKVKEEKSKTDLKFSIKKTKIMVSGPISSWQNRWGRNGNSGRFYFLGLHCNCKQ